MTNMGKELSLVPDEPGTVSGAQGQHRFKSLNWKVSQDVQMQNEYTKHLADNRLGFATFVPAYIRDKNGKLVPEKDLMDFESKQGILRIMNAFGSIPIYFEEDMQRLKVNGDVRISDQPLSPSKLRREAELRALDYQEVLALAREYGVVKATEVKTRDRLVDAIIAIENKD